MAVPKSALSSRSRSRICAWMVTSSAVVGSSAISSDGLVGEAHRQHHALAHAAGELMREGVDGALRRGDAHAAAAGRPRAARRRHGRSGRAPTIASISWRAMLQHRVERGHRVLEDHRDVAAAQRRGSSSSSSRHDVAAAGRGSRRRRSGAGSSSRRMIDERRDALAGAGFADDAERLAGSDLEADAVDRAHHARHRWGNACAGRAPRAAAPSRGRPRPQRARACGSSQSRTPSPRKLKPITTVRMARPGKVAHPPLLRPARALRRPWRPIPASAAPRPGRGRTGRRR